MRPPWIIAAIWPPVMLAGLPDFAHPAWWGAIALAAALSVFPWTRRSGANARTDLDTEICRAAFHHHIDSITVLRDGRFIAANKAAIIATGLTDPGQFLSREVSSFAPETQPNGENSAAMARGMIAKAVATGHARGEWTRKHTDGRLIPVEVTIVPVELGGKPCVMVYYHDIAERVRAREARNALLTSPMERLDALVARVTNQVKEASRALTDDAAALVEGLDQGTARLSRASAGSREASGNVSAISAATEELSNTIAQILDQMNRRRAVTDTAVAESKAVAETISRLEQAGPISATSPP